MADKQTYTFSNDITTVEVSSLGAKIVVIPQDRADIYVEYSRRASASAFSEASPPRATPSRCTCRSGPLRSSK